MKQLNFYLDDLLANGALTYRAEERRYFTTERGRAFARAFDQYRDTVELLRKQETTLAQYFTTTVRRALASPLA